MQTSKASPNSTSENSSVLPVSGRLPARYSSASETSSTFYGVQQRFCSSYRKNFNVPSQIRFPCENSVSTIRNSGYNTRSNTSRSSSDIQNNTSRGTSENFHSEEVPQRFCSSFRESSEFPSQIRFDCEDSISEIPNSSENGRTRLSEIPEVDSTGRQQRKRGKLKANMAIGSCRMLSLVFTQILISLLFQNLSFQMQEILLLRFALPSALQSPNLRRSSVSSLTKIQFLEWSPSVTI
jgi:hypothetical protein